MHLPRCRWYCKIVSGEPQGETGESQPTESTDDAEALRDLWSIQGDFIHRHHIAPRVQLYLPNEESIHLSTMLH